MRRVPRQRAGEKIRAAWDEALGVKKRTGGGGGRGFGSLGSVGSDGSGRPGGFDGGVGSGISVGGISFLSAVS